MARLRCQKGVVAVSRHLENAGEDVAEVVGPQGWRHADVEQVAGHGPLVLVLELVEVGQVLPCVAVEAEDEVVEVIASHADGGFLLEGLPEAVFEHGHCRLRCVPLAV